MAKELTDAGSFVKIWTGRVGNGSNKHCNGFSGEGSEARTVEAQGACTDFCVKFDGEA